MKKKVCLVYSADTENLDAIRSVEKSLHKRNIVVYPLEKTNSDISTEADISNVVRASDIVLFFYDSACDDIAIRTVMLALELKKVIVPVLLDDTPIIKALQLPLSIYTQIKWDKNDVSGSVAHLTTVFNNALEEGKSSHETFHCCAPIHTNPRKIKPIIIWLSLCILATMLVFMPQDYSHSQSEVCTSKEEGSDPFSGLTSSFFHDKIDECWIYYHYEICNDLDNESVSHKKGNTELGKRMDNLDYKIKSLYHDINVSYLSYSDKSDCLSQLDDINNKFHNLKQAVNYKEKTYVFSDDSLYCVQSKWYIDVGACLPSPSITSPKDEHDSVLYIAPFSSSINICQLYSNLLLVIIISIILVVIIIWLIFTQRKTVVKLSSEFPAVVKIDGKEVTQLGVMDVYEAKLKKGRYRIDFYDKVHDKTKTLIYEVSKKSDNFIFATYDTEEEIVIKIFIAGSIALQYERDALRSAISIMNNHWKSGNISLLSYTYEDFTNKWVEGGHQKLYNEFLKNDASWAIFVFDGKVGGITQIEFDTAVDAYKDNKKPNILVFSKTGDSNNPEIDALKQRVIKEELYWMTYSDLNELKQSFQLAVNYDLLELRNSQMVCCQ